MTTASAEHTRRRVLRAVGDWIADHGEGPSVRQLAAVTGLSLGGLAYQLHHLEEAGDLVRTGPRWRDCRLR